MADDEHIEGQADGQADDRVADEANLVGVRWSSSLDEARATARQLVEHGLGARVEPSAAPAGDGYEVQVLPEEAARAAEVLGGDELAGAEGDEDVSVPRAPVPWRALVAIALVALIVLPLVAGALSFFVMSR